MRSQGILLGILVLIASFSYAQDTKKDLKKAKKIIKKADKIVDKSYIVPYSEVLPIYLEAHDYSTQSPYLKYRIAKCYLNSNKKQEAAPFLEQLISLDPDYKVEAYFELGNLYQLKYEFDKAIEQFKIFRKRSKPEDVDKADSKIAQCELGRKLYA
ncbi:MAG: tetratricopeptide repeat protein, partial [Bacteroidetes bacterium]|nr:tetratricopeptide repeat protein [Bacteroidota bacterium]